MTDYSEHLIAVRNFLRSLEEAASDGRWHDMVTAAYALEERAKEIRFWAARRRMQKSQSLPPPPTV